MHMQVVQMLVIKVGGRYSTELGLNVDAGDEEVEKWFLAVSLFHRHLTFDVLKKTFQVGSSILLPTTLILSDSSGCGDQAFCGV